MSKFFNINILFILIVIQSFTVKAQLSKEFEYYSDSSIYDVVHYQINLNLVSNSTYLSGNTVITAKTANQELSCFYVELSDSLAIDSLLINNTNQFFNHKLGWIIVHLNKPILKETLFSSNIYYHGKAVSVSHNGGIDAVQAYSSSILYTLSEPFYASDAFPCKQFLTDKADSVSINLTVPDSVMAISNGLLKSKKKLPYNKVIYLWESHYPIAYYLIAFSVGKYKEYSYTFFDESIHDSILFQNFLYDEPEYLQLNKNYIDSTILLIKTFEKITGFPFPFYKEKYGHVTAPIGGGMENQTITMVTDFSFELIAHELAQSWFGDMVTCSDWQNIWVNEGFASYLEVLAYENIKPIELDQWFNNALSATLQSPEGSVFIPKDKMWDADRIFSYSLTYRKGAMFIHMLRMKINNDALFFKVLNTFLKTYSYSNANAENFRSIAEKETGINFNLFFQQWFYGFGYPIINFDWSTNNDGITAKITSKGSSYLQPIFIYDLDVLISFDDNTDTLLKLTMNNEEQIFKIKLPSKVKALTVNPYYSIIAKIITNPSNLVDADESCINSINGLFAFPNPFSDSTTLHVNLNNSDCKIELFNLYGKKIQEWNRVNSQLELKMNQYSQGTYLIKASNKFGKCTTKAIKYK